MSCDRRGAAADAAELLYPRSSGHRAKEREVKKRIPGKKTERERGGEIRTTPHQGEKVSVCMHKIKREAVL